MSNSSSSSLKKSEVEEHTSTTLYDDSGHSVHDAPDDETAASFRSKESPRVGQVDRSKPIVMEEDLEDEEGDNNVIRKNQKMRKKSKRGRSSIIKKRIANIGMGVMDDLIESADELSSDDEDAEEQDENQAPSDVGTEYTNFDPSLHPAQSVRSTKTPRFSQYKDFNKDTKTPRNIDSILEENKNFLQTMRKGPLKQATPQMRQKFSDPVPTMSESYSQDNDDYRTFSNSLKAELSGTHSKLYDSFLAMFSGDKTDNKFSSPKPLSVYPGSLDLKTKECISQMSKYLNTEHDIECLIGSQVIKDTDVRNFAFTHDFSGSKTIQSVPSIDSINGGDDGSQFEVTAVQHARSVVSSTNDSRFLSNSKVKSSSIFKLPPSAAGTGKGTQFNQVKLKSRKSISNKSKSTEAVPSSWTKVKLKPVGNKSKAGKRPSVSTEESAEFHRIVLRKTPTNADLKTAPSGAENKPIDLNQTGDKNKPISLLTPSGLSQVSGTATKPIAITPASGCATKPISIEDTRKGGEGNPIKLAPSTGYDEGNPIQLVPSKGDESVNPIVMAPSIDLVDLNEGSIMVPLALDKVTEVVNEVSISVIVGKDGITKVQSAPGNKSTKANVLWRLERQEVKSALLDMSTFSVKVIVSSDSKNKDNKDLRFQTSAHCMKFANALHEMNNANSGGSTNLNDSRVSEADASSVYVEQLSDEEQKVLDEFRQRKKNGGSNVLTKTLLDMHIGNSDGFSKPMSVVNGDAPSSPVSEVSTALSSADDSMTEKKYQLMLKMKVPKDAVKAKMEQDGVDPSLIAKVLGEEAAPKASSSDLSPEEEKKATVYRKMLKMMIPPEAVEHKMKKEGVDPKIISAVLGGDSDDSNKASNTSSASLPVLTIPEQAAAQKYTKMLKMSIPMEAVEHKMKKDGVDAKIVAFVKGQSAAPPPAESKKNSSSSSLTSSEESTAANYRRMMRMNIPKEAVHHKMMKDGVSEKIISAVLGNNKKQVAKDTPSKNKGFAAGGFHWNAIDDDVSVVGSVWSKASSSREMRTSLPSDISKYVEEFQKKPDTVKEARKNSIKDGKAVKQMANLINNNRAQNVAITLKAFNDFSHEELAKNIEFLDPFEKIMGDRALFMKDLLPTHQEAKAIKAYTGSEDCLGTAEKWFQHIVNVKRIEEKVQVIRTIETFKMDAILLGKSFQQLTDVCHQVMASDRLPDLLDMVRQIGNRMNQGRGDDAAGFKLDFLPRLSQTKGSDKKTTALDLVVLIFCTRNNREALMLSEDFPDIQEASRVQFDDLTVDIRSLEASFRKCNSEFEKLKREYDVSSEGRPPKPFSKVPSDSRSETALMNPSRPMARKFTGNDINTDIMDRSPAAPGGSSLMDAIKSRNGAVRKSISPRVGEILNAINKSNEEVRKSMSPRASLQFAFDEKNQGKMEYSLEASIRRLEKFITEANYVILPKLQSQRDEAMEACKELAVFFCEGSNVKAASNLLKILAGFGIGIDQSLRKYDEQQKILARKEAAMKKKNSKTSKSNSKKSKFSLNPLKKKKKQPPAPETASSKATTAAAAAANGEKKSLVLMVNEMLKVAGDKEIEDYVSGNTQAVAGSRLEQIYDVEKNYRTTSQKDDILSSIQRRRTVSTNINPQQALTDLNAALSKDDDADEPIIKARKRRVVNRWSSKAQQKTASSTPVSEVLSSVSENTTDFKFQKKRRQRVVNRWASKSSPTNSEASAKRKTIADDDDDDSDIGAFEAMLADKRKQKAFNRWTSKGKKDSLSPRSQVE